MFGVGLAVWGLGRLHPDLGRMTQIFLKIGVVSFGGGFVMIPILQWDVVNAWHWLTLKQFMDGILLGFITPGPIIILATFVGYRVYGLLGAGVATIAIFLPPILLIIFLTPYYQRLKEARWMRPAIQGILAALVGMLALVTLQMGQAALIGVPDFLLTVATAIALIVFEVNLLWIVPAVVGLSLFMFLTRDAATLSTGSYSHGGDWQCCYESQGWKPLFLILGAMLLWAGQATAAEKDYQALSLEDCQAIARQQNPVLGASRERVQELVADYQAARSKFFPRLVLVSYYDRQPPNRFPPSGNPGPFDLFKREGYTGGYRQTAHLRRLEDLLQYPGRQDTAPRRRNRKSSAPQMKWPLR